MLHASKIQWWQDIGSDTALLQQVCTPVYKFENLTAGLPVRPFSTTMVCLKRQNIDRTGIFLWVPELRIM